MIDNNQIHLKAEFNFVPWLFVFCMSMTVLLNNYQWSFSGVTLSPERIMSVPLTVVLVLWLVFRMRAVSLSKSTYMLAFWLGWVLLASILSDVPDWSLKMYVTLLMAVSYYYLVNIAQINPFNIFSSRTFLLVAWFFGPVLSILYIMYLNGFVFPGLVEHWFQTGSGGIRLRGTIYEPNLFGAYLTLFILAVLAMNHTRKLWWWVLLAGLHFSLIFSFSRSPWIAYLTGLFFYLVLRHPGKLEYENIRKYFLTTLFVSFVFGVIVYLVTTGLVSTVLLSSGIDDNELLGRTHSIRTRFVMWSLSLESIVNSPLLGNGIFSFSALHPEAPSLVGSDTHRSAWVSNLPLAVLHDSGLVGFSLFFIFIGRMLVNAWFGVRRLSINHEMSQYEVNIGAALLASVLSLMVSSLTIPSHSLAIFWVVLALLGQFIVLTKTCRNNVSG